MWKRGAGLHPHQLPPPDERPEMTQEAALFTVDGGPALHLSPPHTELQLTAPSCPSSSHLMSPSLS